MLIKVRHAGDIRNWENIPVTMRTRVLETDEKRALYLKLREWCQTEFVVSVQCKDDEFSNSIYFENLKAFEGRDGSFFRWINEELTLELT